MNTKLDGKTAIITGGAQGIGLAIAEALANEGALVGIADLKGEQAKKVADDFNARGKKAISFQVNVADSGEVRQMIDQAMAAWNKIDILVNNAGITRDGLIIRMKEEDWNLVLDINLNGTFFCIKEVLSKMAKQRSGRIINISSIVGAMGNAGQANYVASKAAVIGLTKTVAKEYASRGITVNAVAPGFIETEMTRVLPAQTREELIKQIPQGRMGAVEDIANAVCFLASDQASYITGQVIHVNGGMYMV
ncbi:MAG: 3-oxoacyl-[acyl-carrier-protein] reductase [Nitrospirae bacterium]|nr:3-oxoacyl-[acyl-carrier-protein] reductase [Nitrospirota bacterium]MBI3604940.1 3-oxoacyl-[acyl-carrier-protein] reductase [Nitrospirota bacterium]